MNTHPLRIIKHEGIEGRKRDYFCLQCAAHFEAPGIPLHDAMCKVRIDGDDSWNIICFVGLDSPEYSNAERITFDDWCNILRIPHPLSDALYHLCMSKDVSEETRSSIPFWINCMRELHDRSRKKR